MGPLLDPRFPNCPASPRCAQAKRARSVALDPRLPCFDVAARDIAQLDVRGLRCIHQVVEDLVGRGISREIAANLSPVILDMADDFVPASDDCWSMTGQCYVRPLLFRRDASESRPLRRSR